MKKDLLILRDKAIAFILSAVMVVLGIAALHLDIKLFGSHLGEESFTECMQEVLLLLMVAIYLALGRQKTEQRPAMFLVAGFFTCMFIREMDFMFGWYSIPWFPFTLAVTAVAVYYATRRPAATVSGLAKFAQSQSFVLVMSGLLTILVFSRLFGMKVIWIGMLGENYPRVVKNFAEEGVELFGYIQCFLGTAFYALKEWQAGRAPKTAQAHSEEKAILLGSEATERTTS